ncbi:hypothetical protein DKP78_26020, partial [Enterococcus faecium]
GGSTRPPSPVRMSAPAGAAVLAGKPPRSSSGREADARSTARRSGVEPVGGRGAHMSAADPARVALAADRAPVRGAGA